MDEKFKFKFSLANLLWMMVPLAVALCLWRSDNRRDGLAYAGMLMAIAVAVATLFDGPRRATLAIILGVGMAVALLAPTYLLMQAFLSFHGH